MDFIFHTLVEQDEAGRRQEIPVLILLLIIVEALKVFGIAGIDTMFKANLGSSVLQTLVWVVFRDKQWTELYWTP